MVFIMNTLGVFQRSYPICSRMAVSFQLPCRKVLGTPKSYSKVLTALLRRQPRLLTQGDSDLEVPEQLVGPLPHVQPSQVEEAKVIGALL